MENNSTKWPRVRRRWQWLTRLLVTVAATVFLTFGGVLVAGPAQATDVHIKDRYGHSVRVPDYVVVKLATKHNVHLRAEALWLPKSALKVAEGTRKEFRMTLVKVRCETLPLVGRVCWRTSEKVVLLSIVDYRTNRQGLQQGLVTAYCVGLERCPSWVNRPLVSGGGSGGGGGGGW